MANYLVIFFLICTFLQFNPFTKITIMLVIYFFSKNNGAKLKSANQKFASNIDSTHF